MAIVSMYIIMNEGLCVCICLDIASNPRMKAFAYSTVFCLLRYFPHSAFFTLWRKDEGKGVPSAWHETTIVFRERQQPVMVLVF